MMFQNNGGGKKTINIFLVVVMALLIAYGAYSWYKTSGEPSITSFEQCLEAGYPVMESYPRQCKVGKITFLENIENSIEENPVLVPELEADVPLQSPLSISGKAVGSWFFEGSFPVRLYDENGVEISQGQAVALSDWMTAGYVQFTASLEFATPSSGGGYIEFQKDNPSGLPENESSVRFPVKFK